VLTTLLSCKHDRRLQTRISAIAQAIQLSVRYSLICQWDKLVLETTATDRQPAPAAGRGSLKVACKSSTDRQLPLLQKCENR
jgi:hypothetical protein